MRKRLFERRFLNRKGFHSSAHIIASVHDTSEVEDTHGWWDAYITIADCSRQVTLDFDDIYGDAKHRENALRKADMLADAVTQFRDELHKEAAVAAKRNRKNRKARPSY